MKYLFLVTVIVFYSVSFLFAGAEVQVKGGKVNFLYDAEQTKVAAFVAVGTTTEMTNKYTKPSAFETMVSTTVSVKTSFEFENFTTKAGILPELRKIQNEVTTLNTLSDSGMEVSAELTKANQKLAGLKHIYSLAP